MMCYHASILLTGAAMASKRQYDDNGWLTVIDNPIAKSGVFDYLGSEIGADEPDRTYQVLCSPEEFSNEDFLASLNLLPIIDDHELIGNIGTSTDQRPAAGVTGADTRYNHPYILSTVKFYSDNVQRVIDKGKVQLSTAYTCEWVKEDGEYKGKQYQYRQIPKVGNHLAIVDSGRFGREVAVQNRSAFVFNSGGFTPMNQEELLAEIAKLGDEGKAALLAALAPAQNEEDEEVENTADEAVSEATEAEASADEAEEAVAEVAEAVVDGDQAAAERAADAAVVAAETALEDAEALQDKITDTAMNAAVKHIDMRNAMAAKVQPFIGAVPAVAMNSAESIAAYSCKKLGVPHVDGNAELAINAYLHGRKPVSEQAKAAMNSKPADSETIKTKLWGAK